jgi:hypothetical protein
MVKYSMGDDMIPHMETRIIMGDIRFQHMAAIQAMHSTGVHTMVAHMVCHLPLHGINYMAMEMAHHFTQTARRYMATKGMDRVIPSLDHKAGIQIGIIMEGDRTTQGTVIRH